MLESIGRHEESVESFKQYVFAREREELSFHAKEYPYIGKLEKTRDESIDVFLTSMAEYSRSDVVFLALGSWRHMRVLLTKVSTGDFWNRMLINNTAHHFSIGLSRVQHHIFDAVYLESTQGMSIDEKMECYLRVLQLELSSEEGGFSDGGALDCLSN
jgi:hypothetical protein